MNLQLSLKQKWFSMSADLIKREDYREINDYWGRRLLTVLYEIDDYHQWAGMLELLRKGIYTQEDFYWLDLRFKNFTTNTITLGYPKKTDCERIRKFEHAGIEIGTGKTEWGAEEGKIYFVIKHGNLL